jgi:lipoyl(octanoyl) transferase
MKRQREIDVQWLGRRGYAEVWELQRQLLEQRIDDAIGDMLLLVEHEPVYTWGKRTAPEHLGAGPEALRALGADAFEVERGGEVTYHGPGQLTGYPICNLKNLRCGRDLHKYMRGLEEMIIRVLSTYGLRGERIEGWTGVWVGESGELEPPTPVGGVRASHPRLAPGAPALATERHEKVAALGVRVRKWCTMHGFALNVSNECLPWFEHITPCGIEGRGVTSLEKLLGRAPEMSEVRGRVVEAFRDVLL